MSDRLRFAFILGLLFLSSIVLGCASQDYSHPIVGQPAQPVPSAPPPSPTPSSAPTSVSSPAPQQAMTGPNGSALDPAHQAMVFELLRLQQLSLSKNLTHEDLVPLGNLTLPDDESHREWVEADWMIDHGYGRHVEHSISAMYYIITQGEYLCPADPLSHVGVFLKYNETELARSALIDANATLADWENLARDTKAKNPSTYPGLDDLLGMMHKEIQDYADGNFAETIRDAAYIDQNGYC